MTQSNSIRLVFGVSICLLVVGLLSYYFFGNHNCAFSRSYQLEKEIRDLHYFETHEPISDYAAVADRYESLLKQIRFARTGENLQEKYEQAITRSKWKAQICALISEYKISGKPEPLQKAFTIFTSEPFKSCSPLRHVTFQNKRLHQSWFKDELAKFYGSR